MSDSDPSVFENYLHDLGILIREMAMEAKLKTVNDGRNDYNLGYIAGFHRVVSLMQQQAEAFNLPLEKISLDGLDPDEELI